MKKTSPTLPILDPASLASSPAQRAHEIYGDAPFADRRHRRRVIQACIAKMSSPARSLSRSAHTPAEAKGAYRLVSNYRLRPDQKRAVRVTAEQLWRPLFRHGAESSRGAKRIYAVQDTSCLMYPTLRCTRGLGAAERPKEEALWMHSALGVRGDGEVLGLYDVRFWARPVEEFGKSAQYRQRAFEDKESHVWVEAAEAVETLFQTHELSAALIHVADRGGDVHEVLQHYLDTGKRFIIRVAYDRRTQTPDGDVDYVFSQLAQPPVLARKTIRLPRTKRHPARPARVEVRASRLTISPSAKDQRERGRRPFQVNVISVREPHPPAGVDGVHWVLYTSESIDTPEACWDVVKGYKLRWRIEDYHRVLKNDCYAEQTQLKDAASILRLLAFLAVAAIRVLQLRDRARRRPEAPCTPLLSEEEWRVLWLLYHEEAAEPGRAPPTLGEAVRMIGRLGGHLGRRGDGMPGAESLARGLRELETARRVYRLLVRPD